jgi:hypothetical protein
VAEKTISQERLDQLERGGARIQYPKVPDQIEGFSDLVNTLKQMVANEEERVRADLARNQTTLEILGTLQSLIRKQGSGPAQQPIDLQPVMDLLEEIRAERQALPVDYDFNIIRRGGDGFQPATKIEARAVTPQVH